ncbi:hypothetical protein SPRG_14027 [Saprolegnia parasitica CBS 223.65]|uniref:FHA domain-containing protein n=1 Tax=Saprolegnia parasitica (strain CBS 223.65) TaxID=695850 RepID=A0A067C302_SAPPC|nr:hypothetical protein SPRG_14027 [Saprolegnia parasitica CBS 223.65]KDO20936.1 hypothetical protein SPRG_14027 [Saprolegnia parasitica CBS 223.65]|eukprot:XP_012208328.1 hypothetical protein SPRG_14027 [Saprolegnia parasitica CBS 223.65]
MRLCLNETTATTPAILAALQDAGLHEINLDDYDRVVLGREMFLNALASIAPHPSIDLSYISRAHCTLERAGHMTRLVTDLSYNGTRLNGIRLGAWTSRRSMCLVVGTSCNASPS